LNSCFRLVRRRVMGGPPGAAILILGPGSRDPPPVHSFPRNDVLLFFSLTGTGHAFTADNPSRVLIRQCSSWSPYYASTRFLSPLGHTHPKYIYPLTSLPVCALITTYQFFISGVRHALCFANIVADERYMPFTGFFGENGRRLRV
jgi:hypothetical protein